jgi:hypothetical protein
MPGQYSNDFHNQGVVGGNTVFHPQVDHYNPGGATFGDMVVGQSVPYFSGPPVDFNQANGGGLTLTVNKTPADPAGPESRPLYVPHPTGPTLFTLSNGGTLTAEAHFDNPMADTTGLVIVNPLDYVWALGVVLKHGDQNEPKVQQMISTTCQFFNGGYIHFHGTDYANPAEPNDPQLVSTGTYEDYEKTNFRLSLTISRQTVNGAVVLSGTATLWVGPDKFTGNLRNLNKFPDLNWVMAVGFSLVSLKNLLPGISIRVKKFTLSVEP